jgi:modulator of FtsH protease HflC
MRYRSEGEEEAAKLRAETDKQREIILAQAYEQSQWLQGEGNAAATAVLPGPTSKTRSFISSFVL